MNRLLPPGALPNTLWSANTNTLLIPQQLARPYCELLRKRNLETEAISRDKNDSPTGGPGRARTDDHLARAFDGSVARVCLSLLDPLAQLGHSSNAIVSAFSSGRLVLADSPCGAGAASLGILAAIAELRAQSVLPREPLSVHLIGAEISAEAREYAAQLLDDARASFEREAILVTAEWMHWDATEKESTTRLVTRLLQCMDGRARRLITIANFNAALEKEGKRKDASPQLEELMRYANSPGSAVVWIEPQMNTVTQQLFPWVAAQVSKAWKWFAQLLGDDNPGSTWYKSEAKFVRPIDPSKTLDVRAAVMVIKLGYNASH